MNNLKERFNNLFANLPIPERKNPIYVDDKYGAMSWFIIKLEVDHDTELGLKALEFLNKTETI